MRESQRRPSLLADDIRVLESISMPKKVHDIQDVGPDLLEADA